MTPHALAVGQPYDPRRRSWPEAADYNFRAGGHELRIFLAGPTPEEIEAIRSGPVEFGMFAEPEGLLLATRFGRTVSFDTPYQWHRALPSERVPPPPLEETSPEARAPLTIVLVDASTGIVLALRTVTFSPEFTRALHRAIGDQVGAPYDRASHDRWADETTRRHSTDPLWERCTTRCQGGK